MIGLLGEWKGLIAVIVNTGLGVILGWIGWSLKRRFVPREDFDAQSKAHSALETRVASIETRVAQLPNAEDIHALTLQITELKGALGVVSTRFDNITGVADRLQHQVDRIDGYLRTKGV